LQRIGDVTPILSVAVTQDVNMNSAVCRHWYLWLAVETTSNIRI